MKYADIPFFRLRAQHIVAPRFDTPEQVVAHMGAMQAQDYHQAVWAIGARLKNPSLEAVEASIAAGTILRSWPQRGTIHFMSSREAHWRIGLSAAKLLRADERRRNQIGLTLDMIARASELLGESLKGRRLLSRPSIMSLLASHGLPTKNGCGYHTLWYLSQSGLLCIGPMEGKQQTFALLDEWAAAPPAIDRHEALARLARSYFTSHGPATMHDFAWWAGITMADAKTGLAAVSQELRRESIEGVSYWLDPALTVDDTVQDALLLPGFDEYLLGYKDRSAVLATRHAPVVVPGNNGIFRPIIIESGHVSGVWRRAIKGKRLAISLERFESTAAPAALRRQSQMYAQFGCTSCCRNIMMYCI